MLWEQSPESLDFSLLGSLAVYMERGMEPSGLAPELSGMPMEPSGLALKSSGLAPEPDSDVDSDSDVEWDSDVD